MQHERQCRLTTIDNPYDPFGQFSLWFLFDVRNGYNTCGKLDRIANVTEDMTEEEANAEHERAIDKIMELDFLNVYRKVFGNDDEMQKSADTPA